MSSTIFIAVRCFECSTMQVKQKKKGSNKWTCVVCNEKQSMRKVFAQGFMARDVRKFVQTFNMSRSQQFEQQQQHCTNQTLDLVLEEHSHDDQPRSSNDKKRRSDWSEYIDPNDIIHCTKEEDGKEDLDLLPQKELFKRPTADSSTQDGDDRGFWPPHFHKRNSNKGKEPINFEPTANWASNRFDYKSQAEEAISTVDEGLRQSFGKVTEDYNRPRKSQMGTMKGTSKWDSYITDEDDAVDLHLKSGRGFFTDHKGLMDDSVVFDTKLYDRSVEEDIHPDFL